VETVYDEGEEKELRVVLSLICGRFHQVFTDFQCLTVLFMITQNDFSGTSFNFVIFLILLLPLLTLSQIFFSLCWGFLLSLLNFSLLQFEILVCYDFLRDVFAVLKFISFHGWQTGKHMLFLFLSKNQERCK